MKNASLNYKSSSVSIGWPMLSQRGVVTQIDNKIKESKCGISRSPTQDTRGTSYKWYLQVVSFQQTSDVHKKCKIQASTIYPKCIPLHQWETHLLWKLMTKGERLYKDMKTFIRGGEINCVRGEIRYESLGGWTWIWTKREQHWRKEMDQKFSTREAHK